MPRPDMILKFATGLLMAVATGGQAMAQCDEPLHAWYGDDKADGLGISVGGAGDVDGDGHADVLVGSATDDANGENAGSAYVFSGADGEVIHAWHGDSAEDRFGISVAGAGDADGDGVDDVLIGAPWDDANGTDSGSAYLYSGATGELIHAWHGDSAEDWFGIAVAGAGDADGDGVDDVVVGAHQDDANGTDSGSAYLLSGATGELLHAWHGDSAGDRFGISVAGAGGDATGDGLADVVVGASNDAVNGPWSGSAYLFSGATGELVHAWHGANTGDFFGHSVGGAGDVDADGLADVIVGALDVDVGGSPYAGAAYVFSGATGELLHEWLGDDDPSGDEFGVAVDGAGDVDGDGHADLIVGALYAGENDVGAAYAFSGATGELLRVWIMPDQSPGLDLFGASVGGAGDVNADGFDDVIIGAYKDDTMAHNGGAAFVFSLGCCPADVNGDGNLDVLDFVAFQLGWVDQDPGADCDANGEFNVFDFVCFQQLFVQGCE